ncbi:Type I restriction-modification system, specificity subunit S [Bacillus sp. ZZV12-4809]|nr:Type I restriction-modification system, specificity subunit S [Bacillus sp. ZZV12-4809]
MIKEVKLQEILDIRDGTHDSPKYVNNGYPLVTSKNIKDGTIDFSNVNLISKEDFDKINKRSEVQNGDIIMPMIGTIGNPVIVNTDKRFAIKNVALFKFESNELLNNDYLFYYLKSKNFYHQINLIKRGGTQSFISLSDIRNLMIPMFTVSRQREIVNILKKAESLINKRKGQILELSFLTKSIFLEMFGDPISNSKGINTKKGSELFNFSSGKFLNNNDRTSEQGYPVYGGNGINGLSQSFLIDYSTIVIGRVGAYCGSIHRSEPLSWVTDNAIYIKNNKMNQNIYFLYHLFQNLNLNRFADYSGQPKITQKPLLEIDYIYPPMSLQNQFEDKLRTIEILKEKLEISLELFENNFNSLMQRAFKGDLFND